MQQQKEVKLEGTNLPFFFLEHAGESFANAYLVRHSGN